MSIREHYGTGSEATAHTVALTVAATEGSVISNEQTLWGERTTSHVYSPV